MMWKNLRDSRLGLAPSRAGNAGFLLFCLLCFSSAPLFSSPSSAPATLEEMPIAPEQPTSPPQDQPSQTPAKMTDAQLIGSLGKKLAEWTVWSADYLSWAVKDRTWKAELVNWWNRVKTSSRKQIEDRDKRIDLLEAENGALRLENALLKDREKSTDAKMIGAAIGGAGAGALIVAVLEAIIKK